MRIGRRLAAEAIGTFALVFFGAGAIMVASEHGSFDQVGTALAFGLVIAAMVYAFGHISGAHLNPAVSFAFALSRHFPWRLVGGYWAAQCVGARRAGRAPRVYRRGRIACNACESHMRSPHGTA